MTLKTDWTPKHLQDYWSGWCGLDFEVSSNKYRVCSGHHHLKSCDHPDNEAGWELEVGIYDLQTKTYLSRFILDTEGEKELRKAFTYLVNFVKLSLLDREVDCTAEDIIELSSKMGRVVTSYMTKNNLILGGWY